MQEKYPLIRCSIRFQNVVREISQQLGVSGPVAIDLILEGYYKGGLVMPGQSSKIYKIISVHEKNSYTRPLPIKKMTKGVNPENI
jgi:hypothetical protein